MPQELARDSRPVRHGPDERDPREIDEPRARSPRHEDRDPENGQDDVEDAREHRARNCLIASGPVTALTSEQVRPWRLARHRLAERRAKEDLASTAGELPLAARLGAFLGADVEVSYAA